LFAGIVAPACGRLIKLLKQNGIQGARRCKSAPEMARAAVFQHKPVAGMEPPQAEAGLIRGASTRGRGSPDPAWRLDQDRLEGRPPG
jgi:hypothetical protein